MEGWKGYAGNSLRAHMRIRAHTRSRAQNPSTLPKPQKSAESAFRSSFRPEGSILPPLPRPRASPSAQRSGRPARSASRDPQSTAPGDRRKPTRAAKGAILPSSRMREDALGGRIGRFAGVLGVVGAWERDRTPLHTRARLHPRAGTHARTLPHLAPKLPHPPPARNSATFVNRGCSR